TDLRTGEPTIDENQAQYSASNYLATHDIDGEVSTTFNSVTVTVSRDIAMSLLKLFGATNHQITVMRIAKPSDQ
ncbi:MAG: hypothetical protein ACKOGL_08035, partial [Acidimicrobiaceae bacterium]